MYRSKNQAAGAFIRDSYLECGDESTPAQLPRRGPRQSPLRSSASCRRSPRRELPDGCDRSQTTKALTDQRTPKLLPEAVAVLTRDDKCLDQFRLFEVAIKLVQLVKPELVATIIRVAAEINEVFHHHKHLVALRAHESFVFS